MRLPLSFLLVVSLHAATVPNRFIVELTTEPVATHIAAGGARADLASTTAVTHRARIAREQQQVRLGLQLSGAQVLDSVDTVANALLVQVSANNPQPWAGLPNVLRVTPVHTVSMLLDRAVIVNHVTEAWALVGGSGNAGVGMKIGIIDSGVDVTHPVFQNSPLVTPQDFPLVNAVADTAFTNNKVIVARSYVSLLRSQDPDTSARDRVGHGTALATISAGGTAAGPLATITGIASGAWIGSYKVFGTPGYNDEATDDAILKALDDAVKDGMDVVNLSLGSDIAPRLGDDVEVEAIERATAAGVLVVVAAGNNGTDSFTVASPGTAPDAITVGAQENDRTFSASVQADRLQPLLAYPGNGPAPGSAVTGTVVDVEPLDRAGLACSALPAGSLSNRIALILRGVCTFETKLKNAAAAGASAGIVYATAADPDPINMDVGTATLPAEMISNSDGLLLKQAVADGAISSAVVTFTLSPVRTDPNRIAPFSAAGPNVDLSIKPDVVAVGDNYYTATQSFDPNGDMYSADGFILVAGTSFSTPTVAGAAALLKAARPGFTADQYRSMLINSASPLNGAGVQHTGAGSLNSGASLLATAAAYPTSLSFGAGGSFADAALELRVSNTGTAAETFTLTALPTGAGPAPAFSPTSLTLDPGATGTVSVTLTGANLAPGSYEGFVLLNGANSGVEMRVPYWYGVTSGTPFHITDLDSTGSARRGSLVTDAILFRVTDAAGLPLANTTPVVTNTSGGGKVVSIRSYDSDSPGLYSVSVRLGSAAGTNTFRVQAGDVTSNFLIVGN